MSGPILFGFLVSLAVLIGFGALWRMVPQQDTVEARLREYGVDLRSEGSGHGTENEARRPAWSGTRRLLTGLGLGARLAEALARADLPMTAPEFALIVMGAAIVGGVVGTLRAGPLFGFVLGTLGGYVPLLYLGMRGSRRRRTFTAQLPDVLTLLVGGLRAGHGLSQAMETVAEQVDPPASLEFARAMRGIELGQSVQQALEDMSERVGSDDLDLVITAINVQYEMGGNLAQTLETIGETVKDRIRILREIRVLTAQQRLSGYILAAVPAGLGVFLYIVDPDYMGGLFAPGWIRILPIAAVIMQVAGFLVIRRIVDIEV